jgi:hypothetical protein
LRTHAAVVAPIIGYSSAARMTRPGATIRDLLEPD